MDQHDETIYLADDGTSYIKEESDSLDDAPSIAGIFLRASEGKDDTSTENAAILKLCRSCLSDNAVEVSESVCAAFSWATGVRLRSAPARLPRRLCVRCARTLTTLTRYRDAARTADRMLRDLVQRGMLFKSSISNARNKCLKYFPNLVIKHYLPNYFDAHYVYEDDTDNILNKGPSCEEIKNEIELENTESKYSDLDSNFEEEDLITLDQFNPINREENVNDCKEVTNNEDNKQARLKRTKHRTVKLKRVRNETTELRKNKLIIKQKRSTKKNRLLKRNIQKRPLKKDGVAKQDGDDESNVQIQDSEYVTRKYNKSVKHTKDDELFDEFFKIDTLTLQQQKDDFVRRKETANYSNSKLKCEFCYKGFMHERAYDAHMAKHSEKMGELTCKVCHRHCPSNKVLRKHMDHHKYKFSCKKCSYETKARSSAKLHIDWHNGKQYDCDKCGQIFTRISTLLSHARIKHPTDHICGLCGYSFLGAKGILFHTSLKHRLDNLTIPADGPLCTDCDVRFANEDALFTHQRVSPRHGECKRNDAPPVPPKFKRQTKSKDGAQPEPVKKETRGRRPLERREPKNRKQPGYTNAGAEPLHCEQCGVKMNSGTEYRVHFHKYHPNCTRTMFPSGSKPSLCDICGKMFKTPAVLNDHMTEHSNLPAPHTCDECGKSFRKKSSLALHRNVHLGRRYPCPICGKCFNQVCNRDRHYTYVHSAVKDVKCDYCEKCFKSDEEKKLHTTYVHFKKPYPKRSRTRRPDPAPPPSSSGKRRRDEFGNVQDVDWRGSQSSDSHKTFCDPHVLGT